MKLHLKRKSIALLSILAMLISALYFAPAASAVDLNESESNNTCATADVTYDDYNNYGAISSTTDIDWWRFVPTKSGVINIWMGNIPAGRNYYLYFADSSGALVASSDNSSNSNESMRVRVYAAHIYYLKVGSTSGSSVSQYKLRVKLYDCLQSKVFVSNTSNIDFTPTTSYVLPHLWDMQRDAGGFLNNSATAGFNSLSNSDIVLFDGHGNAGRMAFYDSNGNKTRIYANSGEWIGSGDHAISTLSSEALSNATLIIYGGCLTGLTASDGSGNLITATKQKGAHCVIGWNPETSATGAFVWYDKFFESCAAGKNLQNALDDADNYLKNHPTYSQYYTDLHDRTIAGNANSVTIG